jgi:hypothetical protein
MFDAVEMLIQVVLGSSSNHRDSHVSAPVLHIASLRSPEPEHYLRCEMQHSTVER